MTQTVTVSAERRLVLGYSLRDPERAAIGLFAPSARKLWTFPLPDTPAYDDVMLGLGEDWFDQASHRSFLRKYAPWARSGSFELLLTSDAERLEDLRDRPIARKLLDSAALRVVAPRKGVESQLARPDRQHLLKLLGIDSWHGSWTDLDLSGLMVGAADSAWGYGFLRRLRTARGGRGWAAPRIEFVGRGPPSSSVHEALRDLFGEETLFNLYESYFERR